MGKRKNTKKHLPTRPDSIRPNSIPDKDFHLVQVSREGPLPPPSELDKYEVVVPGSAKIIIDRAGEAQKHLLSTKEKELSHTIKHETRGQYMAFIIAMFAIGGAIYLGANGHTWAVGGVGIAGVAIMLSQFLKPRKK